MRSYQNGNVVFLSREAIRHLHRTKNFSGCHDAKFRQKYIHDQLSYVLNGKDENECEGRQSLGK